MSFATPRGEQNSARRWLVRTAGVITLLSLELVWVGVFVCAARCGKGACPPSFAGAANVPDGDCGHSGAAPAAPGKHSEGTSHRRHCPASNFHYWSAAVSAIGAAATRLVSPFPHAAMLTVDGADAISPTENAIPQLETPRFIVPSSTRIPLRI
jgi:hypothetical protein